MAFVFIWFCLLSRDLSKKINEFGPWTNLFFRQGCLKSASQGTFRGPFKCPWGIVLKYFGILMSKCPDLLEKMPPLYFYRVLSSPSNKKINFYQALWDTLIGSAGILGRWHFSEKYQNYENGLKVIMLIC